MSDPSRRTAQTRSLLFLHPPAKTKEPTAGTRFSLQESAKNPPDRPTRHRQKSPTDRRSGKSRFQGSRTASCPQTLHASPGHRLANHHPGVAFSLSCALQNDHKEINTHCRGFKLSPGTSPTSKARGEKEGEIASQVSLPKKQLRLR